MSAQYFSQSIVTPGVVYDPTQNRYQENRMLFFADPVPEKKHNAVKPRTISDIKKIQNFVKEYRSKPGKSLNE